MRKDLTGGSAWTPSGQVRNNRCDCANGVDGNLQSILGHIIHSLGAIKSLQSTQKWVEMYWFQLVSDHGLPLIHAHVQYWHLHAHKVCLQSCFTHKVISCPKGGSSAIHRRWFLSGRLFSQRFEGSLRSLGGGPFKSSDYLQSHCNGTGRLVV